MTKHAYRTSGPIPQKLGKAITTIYKQNGMNPPKKYKQVRNVVTKQSTACTCEDTDNEVNPIQAAIDGLASVVAKLTAMVGGKTNDETDPDSLPDDEAVKAMSQQVDSNDSELVSKMKTINASVARRQRRHEATRTSNRSVRNAVVSNDPAVLAMSQFSGNDAVLAGIRKAKSDKR